MEVPSIKRQFHMKAGTSATMGAGGLKSPPNNFGWGLATSGMKIKHAPPSQAKPPPSLLGYPQALVKGSE